MYIMNIKSNESFLHFSPVAPQDFTDKNVSYNTK